VVVILVSIAWAVFGWWWYTSTAPKKETYEGDDITFKASLDQEFILEPGSVGTIEAAASDYFVLRNSEEDQTIVGKSSAIPLGWPEMLRTSKVNLSRYKVHGRS
jgi:hypothetical protein